MDQVFAVRQVCEKYLANGKDVFWTCKDLEKNFTGDKIKTSIDHENLFKLKNDAIHRSTLIVMLQLILN